jgi:hypothetical protein
MKVAVLLVLVLLAMRVTSWALQWVVLRLPRAGGRMAVAAGNLAAFALFSVLVWQNLAPGEPMDTDALLFGGVVFGLCATADLFWTPLKPRA